MFVAGDALELTFEGFLGGGLLVRGQGGDHDATGA